MAGVEGGRFSWEDKIRSGSLRQEPPARGKLDTDQQLAWIAAVRPKGRSGRRAARLTLTFEQRDPDMTYRAPINDMLLSLNHGAGLLAAVEATL